MDIVEIYRRIAKIHLLQYIKGLLLLNMQIRQFKFDDKGIGWHLARTEFGDLTLLVGASGVGKTRIVKSLSLFQQIVEGSAVPGISWELMIDIGGDMYEWTGETSKIHARTKLIYPTSEKEFKSISFEREKISLNGKEIAFRNGNQIHFRNEKTPKLNAGISIVNLLAEEEVINPLYEGFQKIKMSDSSFLNTYLDPFSSIIMVDRIEQFDSIETLKKSDQPFFIKLFWCFRHRKDLFESIKEKFCEVFSTVEDLKVEAHQDIDLPGLENHFVLQMKERGVQEWIPQFVWSMGMIKTLASLCEIELSAPGSIILADEFENSLGINCIEQVTRGILSSSRNIQYIFTSHHPYIINNVDHSNWKIVSREGGKVSTHGAEEFNLGKSKHSAFNKLMNLDVFLTGQTSDI